MSVIFRSAAFWRLLLVTGCTLGLALCIIQPYVDARCAKTRIGTVLTSANGAGLQTIARVEPGSRAARAGLHSGQIIDIRPMASAQRYELYNPAYRGLILYVMGPSGLKPIQIAPSPYNPLRWDVAVAYAGLAWMLLFAGVLAARRPDDRRARILAALLIGIALGSLLLPVNFATPWPWLDAFASAMSFALLVPVALLATYALDFVVVVSAFVLGEWLIGKAADAWLPQSQKGLAGQAVVLLVALVIGLSARSIHAVVERRLNALFFARRARALSNLRRFASETDVVTKSPALLTMFYDAVVCNSEASYVAVYLRDGVTFVLTRGSTPALPAGLDEDDAAVVHLRRWSEPYEHDAGAHPFSEALIVPMTVHGTLFGILVCGPKRERTHFSTEETEALAQAAHRTGIAYVFLSHQSIVGGTPLLAPT